MHQLCGKQALPSPALLPRQVRLDLVLGFLLAQQVFFLCVRWLSLCRRIFLGAGAWGVGAGLQGEESSWCFEAVAPLTQAPLREGFWQPDCRALNWGFGSPVLPNTCKVWNAAYGAKNSGWITSWCWGISFLGGLFKEQGRQHLLVWAVSAGRWASDSLDTSSRPLCLPCQPWQGDVQRGQLGNSTVVPKFRCTCGFSGWRVAKTCYTKASLDMRRAR